MGSSKIFTVKVADQDVTKVFENSFSEKTLWPVQLPRQPNVNLIVRFETMEARRGRRASFLSWSD
jgi:hypothetical protein